MKTISRALGALADFSGRDRPGQFWPYAACVAVLGFIFITVTMNLALMTASTALTEVLAKAFAGLAIGFGLIIALLAAAVTRRLHDLGRPGYWGLAPVVFIVCALTLMPLLASRLLVGGEPPFGLIMILFLNNLCYLGSLGFLVFLLAQKGEAQPNRYGPAST